jgi:membrane peptidoglycan carboxypeptidase
MSSHLTAPGRHLGRSILRFIAASTALGLATVGLLTPVAAIIGVYGADVVNIAKTLPASLANVEMQSPSTLYGKLDGKDVAFATFYEKNRVPLTAEEIPDVVKNAVVSIEDPRFYEHGGVDFAAVMRAVLQNQSSGSTQSGASTITMQLVRNLRIESAEWEDNEDAIDSAREETASRKLLEMRYAIGLEHNYTKEQILTSYLNYASFGGNVYGIGAAAQYYYGKDAKDLTLPEAAQLVSVFPSPNSYRVDVADNLDRAKARRDLVLQRMVDRGYIDQAAADEAIATPITPHITQQPRGCEVAEHNAAYFCDYVVNLIRNDSTFGDTADDRTALLRRGGLQIYTSIDLSLQDEVQGRHRQAHQPIGQDRRGVDRGPGGHRPRPRHGAEPHLLADERRWDGSEPHGGELQHELRRGRLLRLPRRLDLQGLHPHRLAEAGAHARRARLRPGRHVLPEELPGPLQVRRLGRHLVARERRELPLLLRRALRDQALDQLGLRGDGRAARPVRHP